MTTDVREKCVVCNVLFVGDIKPIEQDGKRYCPVCDKEQPIQQEQLTTNQEVKTAKVKRLIDEANNIIEKLNNPDFQSNPQQVIEVAQQLRTNEMKLKKEYMKLNKSIEQATFELLKMKEVSEKLKYKIGE